MAAKSPSRLVYSTDLGRTCPSCRHAMAQCVCKRLSAAAVPAGDGTARVRLETKGRGGKAVTTVKGLSLPPDTLAALGKRLRAACGAGGTCKDGELEVQGDHAEKVIAWLLNQGYRAKRSGG